MTVKGCFLLLVTMLAIMTLGILSIVQTFGNPTFEDNPSRFFAPTRNHFGFLWLFSSVGMLLLVPLYVTKAYKAALVFTFRKSDDSFLRDNRLVAKLRRLEYFCIRETRDPDNRYLYLLQVVYNDGEEMLLHNGYDEREIMNLANELSSFVGCETRWK